jgi:hypothetical protein
MANLQRRTIQFCGYLNQRGSVAVITAILLAALIGIAALAVDIGYVAVSKNELQNVADAAALAGAGKLGQLYAAKTPPLSLTTSDPDDIATAALSVGGKNKAAGLPPSIIKENDITIGYWNGVNNTFGAPPGGSFENAVRVTARPEASGSTPLGSIKTFFANIFGKADVAVSATATASLTGECTIPPDKMTPFALSYQPDYCSSSTNNNIEFTTKTGCGGWQTFDQTSNDQNMQNVINSIMKINTSCSTKSCGNATVPIPGKDIGDLIQANNGNLSTATWACMQELYDCMKDSNGHWFASVAIIESDCGTIGTGVGNLGTKIESFATIDIIGVTDKNGDTVGTVCNPDDSPCINASVYCGNVESGKGGCSYKGTYGSIPGLVDKTKPSS